MQGTMQTSERQIQERLGGVLEKLARLEHRASSGNEPPHVHNILTDFRRLVRDIERAFSGLQEAAMRQAEVHREAEILARRANALLRLSPLPYILLDRSGVILEANGSAARELNFSERHLRGKAFELFLQSDRQQFLTRLKSLGEDVEAQRWPVTLRPRERYARPFTLIATCETPDRIALVLSAPDGAVAPDLGSGSMIDAAPLGAGISGSIPGGSVAG